MNGGLLTLPMPKSSTLNALIWNLISSSTHSNHPTVGAHLDITESLPATSTRKWRYRDRRVAHWKNFAPGEPNDPNENFVVLGSSSYGWKWNGITDTDNRQVVCSFYIPNYSWTETPATTKCSWLQDFLN